MKSWTKEEIDLAAELINNGGTIEDDGETIHLIDWDFWAQLKEIPSVEAAKLAKYIDPIKWKDDEYNLGKIPSELKEEIARLSRKLEAKSQNWTLKNLVAFLGDDAPIRMIQAATNGQPQAEQHEASEVESIGWHDDPTLTKLEKQRKAILEVIESKGFDAMAIPDGEKGTIEMLCRVDYCLLFDAESSFSTAWKNARHLFKMANHASFAKRGKQ